MFERKPASEYRQMLPFYISECEPNKKHIDFESARQFLVKEDDRMVVEKHLQRIHNMMEVKLYMKTKIFLKQRDIY